MARRRPRPRKDFEISDEARRMLNEDIPISMKVALRMARGGGRAVKRRCKVCGRRATKLQVHGDAQAWGVEAGLHAHVEHYWLCGPCYAKEQRQGSSPATTATGLGNVTR